MSHLLGLTFSLTLLLFSSVHANNLRIENPSLEDAQTIRFDLAWDNAWNLLDGPENHDAAWLFAKYREGDGPWQHLDLSTTRMDHNVLDWRQLEIHTVPDGKGVFAVPAPIGGGNLAGTEIKLRFAQPLPDGVYEFRIFGIEMVYVPEGAFWLGDGASHHSFQNGATAAAYEVISMGTLPVGTGNDELHVASDYAPADGIPAAWPEGYGGFYTMKYELSQAQYADFLNTLSFAQQTARTAQRPAAPTGTLAMSPGPASRSGIRIMTPGIASETPAVYGCDAAADGSYNAADDGQNRACNWLHWDDLAAYLDWAALRPMTEFEFEKACRGDQPPLPGEFAWGTDSVVDGNTVLRDGEAGETVAENPTAQAGVGSHGYDGPQGPLRCGFTARGSSDRLAAGAGYYGAMELSGNLWELCVTVNAEGLAFDGSHGDGHLSDAGAADVSGWPGADGAGFRGGGWNSGILPGFRDLAVSDRFYAGLAPNTRRNTSGGRGARTWIP